MTSAHGAPDLDLIADYLADALPAAEAAQVHARIIGEPRWRAAHDALAGALPTVQHDLSGFAGEITIPADVADRLDAALRAEADRPRPTAVTAKPRTGRDDASRPAGRRDGDRPRGRRYAPRVALALAAVFIAVAGVGFAVRFGGGIVASNATDAKGAAPAAEAPPPRANANLMITVSGLNYTTNDLASGKFLSYLHGGPVSAGGGTPGPLVSGTRTPTNNFDSATSGALGRLTVRSQLDECLATLPEVRAGRPTIVDFAYFNGRPALIVELTDPPSTLALGPACGIEGPDLLYISPAR